MALPNLHELPDTELIELCLKEDTKRSPAWEVLIYRYQRLIYSIPNHYGFSDSEIADVAQVVCLRLLENLSRLRNRQGLGAWLITTTRRECWRWIRRRSPLTEEIDQIALENQSDESAQPEDELVRLERSALVQASLSRLDSRCQHLLTLLFYNDPRPSYDEIVVMLGLPEGSIGPTRARCLEKLMMHLEQSNFFE
jgi:RNA polymerase sigma factor (sigma-70 family)